MAATENMCEKRREKRAPEEVSPVFSQINERFGKLFAGDKTVIPDDLKIQVVDAQHF